MDVPDTFSSEKERFLAYLKNSSIRNFRVVRSETTTYYEVFLHGMRYLCAGFLDSSKRELIFFKPRITGVAKVKWATENPEKTILEIAKVSGENKTVQNMKLLETLFCSGHVSTMQMSNICMKLKTSREVARQIMRHWSLHQHELNVQELSQRYKNFGKKAPVEFSDLIKQICETKEEITVLIYEFFYKDLRIQSKKNRQASFSISEMVSVGEEEKIKGMIKIQKEFEAAQYELYINAISYYRIFSEKDTAREVNRVFLPEAMTPTTFYVNGNIRSWVHYLQARAFNETGISQREHQDLAKQMFQHFSRLCPCLAELMKSGRLSSYEIPKSVSVGGGASVDPSIKNSENKEKISKEQPTQNEVGIKFPMIITNPQTFASYVGASQRDPEKAGEIAAVFTRNFFEKIDRGEIPRSSDSQIRCDECWGDDGSEETEESEVEENIPVVEDIEIMPFMGIPQDKRNDS